MFWSINKIRGGLTLNIEKHLILVKNEDKTEKIDHCEYVNGKWQVVYYKNNKVYTYSFNNVVWLRNPKIIDHDNSVVYDNGQPISGIVKIFDFGDFVRLIFKTRFNKVYSKLSIIIEETCLKNEAAQDCFEYLKKLAEHVSIKLEDDRSFLSKQYSKLTTISPRSVLSTYLERKPLKKQSGNMQPIFPFGFNLSQKAATENALTEQVSVIEGPPGTGKTQTILNIIANAIINNKTVAVVSNNNSATANVLEKLHKYGVDFIAAYLGNRDNKEKFYNEQKNIYPDMSDWTLEYQDVQEIKANLLSSQQKLNEMLELQNRQADLKQKLSVMYTEQEYFHKYYTEANVQSVKLQSFLKISADNIISILIDYQRNIEKDSISFRTKLYNFIIYGIYNFKLYNYSSEVFISFLQRTYYDKKINELNNQIEKIANKLDKYNFDSSMKEYSENSMKLFKSKLAERFRTGENRTTFSDDAIWKNFNFFIKEYPIILSTTHSLRSCASENYLFDYVIVEPHDSKKFTKKTTFDFTRMV